MCCVLLTEEGRIIADRKLVSGALGIIYGIQLLAVFLAYILKSNYNSKYENDE
jgi:hypothetical protein